jgi:hypothetical protein
VIQIAFFVFVNQSLLKQNFFSNEDRDQKLAGSCDAENFYCVISDLGHVLVDAQLINFFYKLLN